MKILYRQTEESILPARYGFAECCLKHLELERDAAITLHTAHCHGEYEIHIPTAGSQTYEYQEATTRVDVGSLLLIPPGCRHRAVTHEKGSEKLAISFSHAPNGRSVKLPKLQVPICLPVAPTVLSALESACHEAKRGSALSQDLAEQHVLEAIVLLLRPLGLEEGEARPLRTNAPVILSMAKTFIKDNIDAAPSPETVALYCHISPRQLSRIFYRYEELTLFDYIRRERTERIKRLLSDAERSLAAISESMHFANEYYFNRFFKQNYGMTPGAYRKMIAK